MGGTQLLAGLGRKLAVSPHVSKRSLTQEWRWEGQEPTGPTFFPVGTRAPTAPPSANAERLLRKEGFEMRLHEAKSRLTQERQPVSVVVEQETLHAMTGLASGASPPCELRNRQGGPETLDCVYGSPRLLLLPPPLLPPPPLES